MTEPAPELADRQPPVLFVVEPEPAARDLITGQMERRYGHDYRILSEESVASALTVLESLHAEGTRVALVLAAQTAPDGDRNLFSRIGVLYPEARRGLLVDWGAWADRQTAEGILRLMSLGEIDYYVLRPWRSPDEYFHRTVTEFLLEWERAASAVPREVTIVGQRWSPRAHELHSLLTRSGIPHAFHADDSPDGRRLLVKAGQPDAAAPVVVLRNNSVLVDPSNAELVEAYGIRTRPAPGSSYDLVVVGAGPAGLAAGVYAASEGLRTLVIERESIGGQAGYSSLIRNYLGFARGISGAELAQRAYQQAWVFGASFLLTAEVAGLRTDADRHILTTAAGDEISAGAVVLATGVSYRRLDVPSLETFSGAGLYYGASMSESRALAGEDVIVVGGGNSAGQAAMHLSRYARSVTLLVRGDSLAESMSQYLLDEIAAAGVHVQLNSEVVDGGGDGRLEWVTIRDRRSGEFRRQATAGIFVLIGANPCTTWLPQEVERDRWGYLLTGPDIAAHHPETLWPLDRPPSMFETCLPRVFAVGDTRRGSVKRVASAVGEGSVVIQQVHQALEHDHALLPTEGSGRR